MRKLYDGDDGSVQDNAVGDLNIIHNIFLQVTVTIYFIIIIIISCI